MFHQKALLVFGVLGLSALVMGTSVECNSQMQSAYVRAEARATPTPRPPSDPVTGPVGPVPGGPNFAGSWVLDKSKGENLNQRWLSADRVTLTISQDDRTISLQNKFEGGPGPIGGGAGGGGGRGGGGNLGGPQSFNLDGREVTSEMNAGQGTAQRTTKATVSRDSVELMTKVEFGDRITTTTQRLSVSNGGKMLTVVTHREGGPAPVPDTTAVYIKQ